MPAVETREIEIVFCWDRMLVEGFVVRMLEGDVGETFVRWDEAVAYDLHLRLVRDGFQVWVQDGALGV